MRFLLAVLATLINYALCHEAKDFDDSILYKIDWPGKTDTIFDDLKYESLVVSTQDKEQYRCVIPIAQQKEEQKSVSDSSLSPLHAISPIFSTSSCSYRIDPYWTYEICHGHHVKQYHEERDGKNIKTQEFYLGKWNDERTEMLKKDLLDEEKSGIKFKSTKIDNVMYPYLEMEMSDGTLCDLNEQPRMTKVRYVCFPHGKNEIYSFKETSSCNYEAVILTSVLCMHPIFVPEDSTETTISCLPINNAPEKPYAWLTNELENLKIKQKTVTYQSQAKDNIAIIKVDKDGTVRMDFLNNINSPFGGKISSLVDIASSEIEIDETPADLERQGNGKAVNFPRLSKSPDDMTPVREFLTGKNCLTGGTGWWKYEFCYGNYVRQFHLEKSGETSLKLGYFDERLHREWLKANPEKRPKVKSLRTDISHLYQGGSVCDKTGEKRQTEVKLKCLQNGPSPTTVSMYLLEPKTCQYILVVESPIICEILQMVDEDGLVPREWISGKFTKSKSSMVLEDNSIRYEND